MGPTTLFDKSFLQGLSLDEAVWFDHFFRPVVCPLFYLETLADLAKSPRAGLSSEEEVQRIAKKFPEINGQPSIFHQTLWIGDLLGDRVPMTGQVRIMGAHRVQTDGKVGDVVKESPETDAFHRWASGEFERVERSYAHGWRNALQSADLNAVAKQFRHMGFDADGCRSLEEIKTKTLEFTSDLTTRLDPLRLSIMLSGAGREQHDQIVLRHWDLGSPRLGIFAPFGAFAMQLEVFFQLSVLAGLISGDRTSNRIDVGYLNYLPFCNLFVSSDKLHRRTAPLFLRPDQEFVWGPDFKKGLAEINEHFQSVSTSEKEKGLSAFALWPPEDESFLVTRLFDSSVPKWREAAANPVDLSPENEKRLLRELNKMSDAHEPGPNGSLVPIDFSCVSKKIRKKRGNWYQMPKES